MKTLNDTNIEICSIISDDDELAIGLNKQIKFEPSNSLHIDLGPSSTSTAALATSSVAFASTEAHDTSIQLQQQRPNKLLRSRAAVNQTKTKDDDVMLIETSLMIMDALPLHSSSIHQPSTSSKATHSSFMPQLTSSASAVASTSGLQNSKNNQLLSLHPFMPSTSTIPQPSTSKPTKDSISIVQDGYVRLTMVQPTNGTANSHNNNITEPELVLSPAKLGQ